MTQNGNNDWKVALGGYCGARNIDFFLSIGDLRVLILDISLNCVLISWAIAVSLYFNKS